MLCQKATRKETGQLKSDTYVDEINVHSMTLSKLGLVYYKQFMTENWYIQDKDSHSVLVFESGI